VVDENSEIVAKENSAILAAALILASTFQEVNFDDEIEA
jgi:hypothetical protein